jgi:hypothetical protein
VEYFYCGDTECGLEPQSRVGLTYHNEFFLLWVSHVLELNHHTSRMVIIVKQFETRVADDRRGSDNSRNVWDLYHHLSSRQVLRGGQVGSLFTLRHRK